LHEDSVVDGASSFKLLAVDLDGTLLDSAHRVPSRNRAALHLSLIHI